MSVESSPTILWINISEPRFGSRTGGNITKTLKNGVNIDGFVNFRLNQIQNCSVQIKKMKDGIFISFQLKKNASPKRLQKILD